MGFFTKLKKIFSGKEEESVSSEEEKKEAGQDATADKESSKNKPGEDAEKPEGRQASQKNAGGAQ